MIAIGGNRVYKTYICEFCGKEFTARADGKPKYCSRQCCGKAKSERERKYETCPVCGVTFLKKRSDRKYCSSKCASLARRKRTVILCSQCGKEFERVNCHVSNDYNFCSKDCANKWKSEKLTGENSAKWNGGVYHSPDGYLLLKQADGTYRGEHRLVLERELGRPLTPDEIVHHLDENKQNNDITNLVIMTRAEHARLHHTKNR